ncbi:succinate receptor 1 [Apodemus sylvaticus]|uniref:succinate receptor 1 n=1 Tax=Apodemus sylvaticus TaxID=10129 RepID=UPI0022448399|nr:succinate receptor 1 [Apodemus sylvaticus]
MAQNLSCENWVATENILKKYYLSAFYGIEFIFGMLGNIAVVFGYVFCMKNWNSSNVYLFNLSISDFAFLCTLPMLIKSYANEKWTYGDVLCISNRYVLHANLYTSILFLTFISIDRYLLMKFPFREHILQKKEFAILISLAVWVLVTLEVLPMLTFINSVSTEKGTSSCMDYASSGNPKHSLIYSLCLTLLGFLIPLSVMCFFYYKMVVFLKRRSQQQITALPLDKPLRLVVLAVVIFSILFTPYHIMRNVRIASRLESWPQGCTQKAIKVLYVLTRPLAFLNSAINPIFYFLMGDHFREMLLSKFRQYFMSLKSFRT